MSFDKIFEAFAGNKSSKKDWEPKKTDEVVKKWLVPIELSIKTNKVN